MGEERVEEAKSGRSSELQGPSQGSSNWPSLFGLKGSHVKYISNLVAVGVRDIEVMLSKVADCLKVEKTKSYRGLHYVLPNLPACWRHPKGWFIYCGKICSHPIHRRRNISP